MVPFSGLRAPYPRSDSLETSALAVFDTLSSAQDRSPSIGGSPVGRNEPAPARHPGAPSGSAHLPPVPRPPCRRPRPLQPLAQFPRPQLSRWTPTGSPQGAGTGAAAIRPDGTCWSPTWRPSPMWRSSSGTEPTGSGRSARPARPAPSHHSTTLRPRPNRRPPRFGVDALDMRSSSRRSTGSGARTMLSPLAVEPGPNSARAGAIVAMQQTPAAGVGRPRGSGVEAE